MANYYDLDDILTEEETVNVHFRFEAAGLGVLDPGSEHENIDAGSDVDIPLWLAHDLCNRKFVTVKLPYFYNERVKKEIRADASCVDLRRWCPYFYELGLKLAPMSSDPTLGSFLLYCLQGRYKEMLCKSHTVALTTAPKFVTLLTQEEFHLFEAARDSMKAFNKWRFQGCRLERAAVLGRKRRHIAVLSPFELS
ncbi:GINS complex subunit 3 [Marchantia polymorpha subsp. ruderalis]|uniref:GINS subunit domain-containing protein n=2 Tax=Marchantia polymorpha TaxID=3197 RepID=A0AAF6BNH6_MARPO|nr:hypothetical protein MARPO_0034s0059 [Marchantia polymorpha]BBN13560.1 hypothetical protein Mp_6g04570 [Marchantia polymorpha subsp. ruderalis]|eukprot:PTQ41472.1 hypothetical protein MARPO_0034s0059 [Marchantia polymorpha]